MNTSRNQTFPFFCCFPDISFFVRVFWFISSGSFHHCISLHGFPPSKRLSLGILRVSKTKDIELRTRELDIADGVKTRKLGLPPVDKLLRDKWEFRLGISKCKSDPIHPGSGYHKWCDAPFMRRLSCHRPRSIVLFRRFARGKMS